MTPTKSQQAQEYAKKKFPELLLTIEKEPWPKTREILATWTTLTATPPQSSPCGAAWRRSCPR